MPHGDSTVEQALGNIALVVDTIPTHDTAKLDYGGITALDALGAADAEASERVTAAEGAGRAHAAGDPAFRRAAAEPNTEEAFYLLATYCFDLQRKMEYLYKATRAFAEHADPGLARALLDDETRDNRAELTWKQRAFRAELRMLQLQREIGREHLDLLRRVAFRGDDQPGAAAAE